MLSGNDINVNEENYIYVLNEFIRHPEEFVGKRITFTGFAYIDKELGSDKFLSGRMMLSCCAADAQLIGFICRYNGINTLRQGEWVRVVGIFKENNKLLTKTGKLPFIEITGLEKIKEPKDKYILQ